MAHGCVTFRSTGCYKPTGLQLSSAYEVLAIEGVENLSEGEQRICSGQGINFQQRPPNSAFITLY